MEVGAFTLTFIFELSCRKFATRNSKKKIRYITSNLEYVRSYIEKKRSSMVSFSWWKFINWILLELFSKHFLVLNITCNLFRLFPSPFRREILRHTRRSIWMLRINWPKIFSRNLPICLNASGCSSVQIEDVSTTTKVCIK